MGRILAAVLAVLALLAGCSSTSTAADVSDGKFIGDVDARGVPTGVTNGTAGAKLGHAICDDLGSGLTAPAKLLQVANLQLNHETQFTMPQAEVIVYWAVTELCPQYSSQLNDSWRDGD